jgi:putative spermidine/putrescine transport system substrate-binding protein
MLANYEELYDWAKDPLGDNAGVGYAINSYLLVYRTDQLAEAPTSWADLLNEDVKGFVTVPDLATTNGPATIVMLATALGGDIDNTEPAWEALPNLAEQLVTTYRRSSELTTLVQQEEVYLAPYSSFAIGNLLETGLPLAQAFPTEGIPAAPSVVSIVAGSEKSELAHKYIDFLISNQVQSAMAMDLVDSPTNTTVELPEDIGALLTYGDDMIESLIFLDQAKLNGFQEEWLERWNEVMLQ